MIIPTINNFSFGAIHKCTKETNPNTNSKLPNLYHTSSFFRYKDLDEFLIKELQKIGENSELNILSAGCSYGEEVYSYAMGLNCLRNKPKIIGIDISQEAITKAKTGCYILDNLEIEYLNIGIQDCTPSFSKDIKAQFQNNFDKIDSSFSTYKKKSGSFQNCDFQCANILDLAKLFNENSQDVILCRNVMQYLSDKEGIDFLNQAHKTLKPNGILCFEKLGNYGYEYYLKKLGFKQKFDKAQSIYIK